MPWLLGEMPGVQGGTPDSLPGRPGLPDKRHPAEIPRAPHRDHRGAAGPDQRSDNGAV